MSIRLYNSMTRRKETLQTLEPGKVRFYACGPTVYDLFHLGNARMFVVFDTIRRYLEYRGYEVRFVQNFTDVDDKIIARANATGKDVRTVANENIEAYFRDTEALLVRRATVHPRVTECIPDIIAFVDKLVQSGYAYARDGDVYFDTSKFPAYGKLSHQSVDEMHAGFRIDANEGKDDPSDFALWKSVKPGEEYWDSPFGPGRPGWHIECSVMIHKYLGDHIDIHGGGRDLIFPHHENEIAQSEAYSGETFVSYWLHNGTLNINGEKMSKSLGNFVTAHEVLEQHTGRAVRYYLLSAHYRHPLNYTEEAMEQSEQAIVRFDTCLRNIAHRRAALADLPDFAQVTDQNEAFPLLDDLGKVKSQFLAAMDDDFNTADAITAVHEAVRVVNAYLADASVTTGGLAACEAALQEELAVLGFVPTDPKDDTEDAGDETIDALVAKREAARRRRDFATADEVRAQLLVLGVVLEDTAQGPRWYRK